MPAKRAKSLESVARLGREVLDAPTAAQKAESRDRRKKEREKNRRVKRAEKDFEFFGNYYLSEYFYVPFAACHEKIFRHLRAVVKTVKAGDASAIENLRIVESLPRAHGKSSLMFLFLTWCACYGSPHYAVYIRENMDVAEAFLYDLREELLDNERIVEDFGNLKGRRQWKADRITTASGFCLDVLGKGGPIKGRRYKQYRPQVVAIDDPQGDADINSPTAMKKDKSWFDRSVLRVGARACAIFIIGTNVHEDSLVAYGRAKPGFTVFAYKAVLKFATANALWDRWRELFREREHNGPARAKTFFEKRKKRMLAGSEVLWPDEHPYYDLMVAREEMGQSAFDAEMQDSPIDEAAREFKNIHFYEEAEIAGVGLSHYAALDPSMARSEKSCLQGFVVIGVDVAGYIYVRLAEGGRVPLDRLYDRVLDYCALYKPLGLAIEANNFQRLVADEIRDKGRRRGSYPPVLPVTHVSDKTARIRSLGPLVEAGIIKFKAGHYELLAELARFPGGMVDVLDALEMAVDVARKRGPIEYESVGTKRFKGASGARELVGKTW